MAGISEKLEEEILELQYKTMKHHGVFEKQTSIDKMDELVTFLDCLTCIAKDLRDKVEEELGESTVMA